MENILIAVAIFAIGGGLGYLLYINGFLAANAKSALFYIGSAPFGKTKNCIGAKFSSCSGVTRRVVYLQEGKQYRFIFSSSITEGTVYVEIQDKRRETVLTLNNNAPRAVLSAEAQKRYYIVTKFVGAGGEYELCWDAM